MKEEPHVRLAQHRRGERTTLTSPTPTGYIDVSGAWRHGVAAVATALRPIDSVDEFLALPTAEVPAYRDAIREVCQAAQSGDWALPADAAVLPVVSSPEKILCVGLNYSSHYEESLRVKPDLALPEAPVVFGKYRNALLPHDATLPMPKSSTMLDFEAEVAVVIGRPGRGIPAERAHEHVAGWTLINDLTLRDLQHRTTQWTLGKSFDGSAPLGPILVTVDELPIESDIDISLTVNGEVLQQGRTSDLIFSVPEIIAYASQAMTLRPGDIIATGTPAGVGVARSPQRFLVPGDVVEVHSAQLGLLRTTIGGHSDVEDDR